MKRVVIVRHAKAVPYGYEEDFSRELIERGKNDALRVSGECKNRGITPGIMVSSPALRALTTARIFAGILDYDESRIIEKDDMYEGMTTREFIEMIQNLPEDADTAFFFGHNPGFYYFVSNLLNHYNQDLPTCAAVGIDFNVDAWNEVEARAGEMSFRITPKMLK